MRLTLPVAIRAAFIVENNDAVTATYRRVQGLIALDDAREEDGGFLTVPGFHRHLSEWADATRAEHAGDFKKVKQY